MNAIFSAIINFLKKIYWKSLVVGLLSVVLFVVVGQYFFSRPDEAPTYTEHVVKIGNLSESIKSSGKAELVDEQRLRFNLTGKVTSVFFSDGDEVKKDEVIAELDKSQLGSDIKQAEINLQNSQISLNNLLEGNTVAEIMRAKNNVNDTQVKISIAESNLPISKNDYDVELKNLDNELELAIKDVDEKEKSMDIAKKNLENAGVFKEDDDISAIINYNSTLTSALNDIHSILIDMQDVLIEIDYVLGVSDERKNLNDTFEYYIGAKDHISANTAVNQIKDLFDSFDILNQDYNALSNKVSFTKAELIELLNTTLDFLDKAVIAFTNYHSTLENTVASENFTQSQIDSKKSAAMGYLKSAKSELESIRNTRNSLINLEASETALLRNEEGYLQKETAFSSAEINLKKSKNTLDNLKKTIDSKRESARLKLVSADNDLINLKSNLAIQQEDLADILDGADKNDIAKARNDVTIKELALERVKDDASKYEIIAPFDGIVRQIDYKSGDNILSDDDKFVYIENPNLLGITILLDQIDIVRVEEGQAANIVFDSLPEKTFTGTIDEVNQTPVDSSGVISYSVSITLNRGEEKIYSGMTAEVEVIINEVSDVLLLPNSAIRNQGGQKGVLIRDSDGNPKIVRIETGETDGKNTELKSGLNDGDIVLEEVLSLGVSPVQQNGTSNPFGGRQGGSLPSGAGTMIHSIQ
ncbi:HlyD family efflux transporter periplasmic adaptor subunit [Patescibacteria group bacterium]|nr:HlyD family efflux transporter periplasmic adaptor subunit [Patescibacteria group bacterium]